MFRPQVASSIHADGVVLLDVTKGRLFAANRIGARIWTALLSGERDAVAGEIAREYGLPDSEVREDIHRFIAELEQHELIGDAESR